MVTTDLFNEIKLTSVLKLHQPSDLMKKIEIERKTAEQEFLNRRTRETQT